MRLLALCLLVWAVPALALTPEAQEFIEILRQLEPVQCEKRKLRRAIVLAEVEKRDATELRKQFSRLDRDPVTEKLEHRLAELEKRLTNPKRMARYPEDLQAISLQQREAFYRCE